MNTYKRDAFAGFWLRFIALLIDIVVVKLVFFPFAIALGFLVPSLFLVEVPFGLFTTTTVVSEASDKQLAIEKDEVLGLWTNHYILEPRKDSKKKTGNVRGPNISIEGNGNFVVRVNKNRDFNRVLINPENKTEISKTASGTIEFFLIFIYWILLEASVWQASVGKKCLGLKVISKDGSKPSLNECIGRNLLKYLSGVILFVGFLMVVWTDQRQALHDRITGSLVLKNQ